MILNEIYEVWKRDHLRIPCAPGALMAILQTTFGRFADLATIASVSRRRVGALRGVRGF